MLNEGGEERIANIHILVRVKVRNTARRLEKFKGRGGVVAGLRQLCVRNHVSRKHVCNHTTQERNNTRDEDQEEK